MKTNKKFSLKIKYLAFCTSNQNLKGQECTYFQIHKRCTKVINIKFLLIQSSVGAAVSGKCARDWFSCRLLLPVSSRLLVFTCIFFTTGITLWHRLVEDNGELLPTSVLALCSNTQIAAKTLPGPDSGVDISCTSSSSPQHPRTLTTSSLHIGHV